MPNHNQSQIVGQLISGDASKLTIRIKSNQEVELGQLLIIHTPQEKYLLQIFDLSFASQLSDQNRELIAGMNLEEDNLEIMDLNLRNYTLAYAKPILTISNTTKTCKKLPPFFASVHHITTEDLSFLTQPENPFFLGTLRSGTTELNHPLRLNGIDILSHHVLIPASTGKGKSNLMSCLLWDITSHNYAGMLVLDPHDEYYGRTTLGLKDHPNKDKVRYYTPASPPPGAKSLKFNLEHIKPEHFQGAIGFSDPQKMCLYSYHKKFNKDWIKKLIAEEKIEGVQYHQDTLAVVKRKLITLLNLDIDIDQNGNKTLTCQGIFDEYAGKNTITDITNDLEEARTVIIDTSYFGGALEILIGTIITQEIFERYKYHKKTGASTTKPTISIVLEEAPRVLGKNVLEQGSNIFETIAREGRKFKVGLIAITQLPSEIPKNILANMNTKIILGLEMNSERLAVIESSPQDLSQDTKTIASLDKGEALVTSTFTKCALPIKIPLYPEFIKQTKTQQHTNQNKMDDTYFS